jgi:hypothetical protein
LEKCWEQNVDVHHVFIDFQAACGTVWRKEIWNEMQKLVFPKKLVTFCRITNNETYAKVKSDKTLSSEFKFNKGWKHGNAVAPLLFNVMSIRKSK